MFSLANILFFFRAQTSSSSHVSNTESFQTVRYPYDYPMGPTVCAVQPMTMYLLWIFAPFYVWVWHPLIYTVSNQFWIAYRHVNNRGGGWHSQIMEYSIACKKQTLTLKLLTLIICCLPAIFISPIASHNIVSVVMVVMQHLSGLLSKKQTKKLPYGLVFHLLHWP